MSHRLRLELEVDRLTLENRSWLPEIAVRSLLHGMGYRFRLHRRDLPGTPDIVLPARSAVVMVHGCFWHGHACKRSKMSKSRTDYWEPKIEANRRRDARVRRRLRRMGWKVVVVWECETKRLDKHSRKLGNALGEE